MQKPSIHHIDYGYMTPRYTCHKPCSARHRQTSRSRVPPQNSTVLAPKWSRAQWHGSWLTTEFVTTRAFVIAGWSRIKISDSTRWVRAAFLAEGAARLLFTHSQGFLPSLCCGDGPRGAPMNAVSFVSCRLFVIASCPPRRRHPHWDTSYLPRFYPKSILHPGR